MKSHSRVCSNCAEEKPTEEFYKDRSTKSGLTFSCKSCLKEKSRLYQERNKDKKRDYDKKYREENKSKIAERKKLYHIKNRDRVLEYQRNHYRDNKEEYSRKARDYYFQNREEILSKSKEYFKTYYQENKDRYALHVAKRRSIEAKAIPDAVLNCEIEARRIKQIYKLRDFLTKATGIEHHVDHIWPLSKGGPHWSGNLQIITAEENLRKGDKLCEDTARVIQESLDEYCSPRLRK